MGLSFVMQLTINNFNLDEKTTRAFYVSNINKKKKKKDTKL